jgi:hypothetical protein
MTLMTVVPPPTCSTSAGFQFDIAGGWHSALSGVLASIVFVAIVFVLTNDPQAEEHRHERGPSLRILFVTFFVFLVASFLWATVAGFGETVPDRVTAEPVAAAVQPVLAVPAAWLLSIGVVLLFFAVSFLVSAYAGHRASWDVAATAVRCFRLIAWLTAVEVWIAIETATRALAGRGWWYSPGAVGVVAVITVPFLFADRIAARVRPAAEAEGGRNRLLGQALGFLGAAAVALVVSFAAVSGQPDSTLLHEGHWCGDGLPWPAAIVAVTVMGLFLVSIAALARALPGRTTPPG